MKVLLRAPLLTNSGYGVHSRQVFEFLYNLSNIELVVECLNWGQTSWLINKDLEDGLVGKIMSKSKKVEGTFDLTIQVQLPDEWDTTLGNKNIGITAAVETDKCNHKWVEACNKMDMIIVPSAFTKKVIKRSGVLFSPIHVIPEWFNQEILNDKSPDLKDERFQFKNKFNFLLVAQLTAINPDDDRKNIFNCIKWILEEFDGEDVGIVLKTNSGKNTSIDRKLTINTLNAYIRNINAKNRGKINLLHGALTTKEMASLYNHPNIDCFASVTRGEGYGLPLVDSAAAGLPVVATSNALCNMSPS